MGLLRKIIRTATKPARAKAHGREGESKVNSTLNPLIFGKVEHRQINNLVLVDDNGKSHQIDHIEIRHNGIFCIETKNYIGWVFGNETSEKWTQTLYTGEKHQFYNPVKQNKSHCYHISKVIGKKYPVTSVIVMANNNAEKISANNVVNLNELKKYLSWYNDGTNLSTEEMDEIYNKLLAARVDITNKEHVENIKKTQREVNNKICPRGGKLVLRKGQSGSFYGCSNYPNCKFTKKA